MKVASHNFLWEILEMNQKNSFMIMKWSKRMCKPTLQLFILSVTSAISCLLFWLLSVLMDPDAELTDWSSKWSSSASMFDFASMKTSFKIERTSKKQILAKQFRIDDSVAQKCFFNFRNIWKIMDFHKQKSTTVFTNGRVF